MNIPSWKPILLTCLSFAVLLGPVTAQTSSAGTAVHGQVTDGAGKPLVGARVTLLNEREPGTGPDPILTDENGYWSSDGLAEEAWRIVAEYDGLSPYQLKVATDDAHAGATLRIQLRAVTPEEGFDGKATLARLQLDTGNTYLRAKRYGLARELYEQALANLDRRYHVLVLERIARTYLGERDSAAALGVLEKADALSPGDPTVFRTTAEAHLQAGRIERSIATLRQLHQASPEDVETLQLLIDLLRRQGREEEARVYFDKLPQGRRIEPQMRLDAAIGAYRDGDMSEALGQLDRAVSEDPSLAGAYYYRGLVHAALENNSAAVSDFQRFLALAPNHPRAREAKQYLEHLRVPREDHARVLRGSPERGRLSPVEGVAGNGIEAASDLCAAD